MTKPTDDMVRIQAAQLYMEAEIKRFEAAVLTRNNAMADEARERAHAHLDQMLDSKAAVYAGFFKSGGRK